jgi:hypothetical protein
VFRDFLSKFKTDQADAPDGASGAAAAGQREIFGPAMRIAEDRYGVTVLRQVHTWTPIEEVLKLPGNFYYLDMDETTLDEAISWIRAVRHVEPFETRRVPVIYLIGPPRPLSSREWREVNERLKSAGGYFYKRPDYNATFEATVRTLFDELARQYGPSARREAWRTQREPDLITR